ncbi:MAG: pilus assembly protein PilM [Deltaproteobacteria bacterium]|nr:pilus assembly protein PilM [Deltaproteobacteria bacterium]
MAQRIAAVDISPRLARVIVLDTTMRNTKVTQAVKLTLASNASRTEILASIKAAIGEKIDTIVIGHESRNVSTRSLSFPFNDTRKIEAAVAFALESQTPYDFENTILSWHLVNRKNNSMDILAAITPKQQLKSLLQDLEQAGIEAQAIIPVASALAELAPRQTSDPIAVISLGETTSHLAIVKNGNLCFSRSFRAGGSDVDRALVHRFGVDVEQARFAKEKEVRILSNNENNQANSDAQKISSVATEGLTYVLSNLITTFKYLPTDIAPFRLLLTGGLSRMVGIADYLACQIGIEVQLVDLSEAIGHAADGQAFALFDRFIPHAKKTNSNAFLYNNKSGQNTLDEEDKNENINVAPEFALALGMAIAVARHGRNVPLNFRTGEFAYQGDIQLFRGQISRILSGIAIVILLAICSAIIRYSILANEESRIDKGFCTATKKIVGREICDPTAALATMRQAPGAGEGVVIPAYSAASLLEMMSKNINEDIDVNFENLELRVDGRADEPDRITGKGEAASFDSTEKLSQSLKRDPCVQEVNIGKQRRTRDGARVEFNLTVKINCPAGSTPGHLGMVSNE